MAAMTPTAFPGLDRECARIAKIKPWTEAEPSKTNVGARGGIRNHKMRIWQGQILKRKSLRFLT